MAFEEKLDALLVEFAELKQQQSEILDRLRSTPTMPTIGDNKPLMADDAAELFSTSKHLIYLNKDKIKHVRRYGRYYFFPSSLRDFLASQQSQQNA